MSIALANLTINVHANTAVAVTGMQRIGDVARTQMMASADAVDGFRNSLDNARADVDRAAQQMGRNMSAANDTIITTSKQSELALKKLSEAAESVDTRSIGQRISEAMGSGAQAGYIEAQNWVEKTSDYVGDKLKIIAIGLAIAAVSATAAVVYGAYRIISGTLDFITGLVTGDSYKSASIDSLIALNDQVKDLQRNLNISAQEASALLDATARLGVSKGDYTSTYKSAETAMRTNGKELDRLGVKYKDSNGKLLEQGEFLANVKTKLEEYAAGWDRTAAATAIGVGSLETISQVLKVSEAQLQASKERLDEFGLGFGPERQAHISAYERAMREFKHESKLMGDGIATAWADQIMPAFTRLAEFFKEGWPLAVRTFRYTMATVTSLLYGLVTVYDVVVDAAKGAVMALGEGFAALGKAAWKALQGDFSGAGEALRQGWENAGKVARATMDQITSDATRNRDAMILAWGLDDRTTSLAQARAEQAKTNAGKPWIAATKPEPSKTTGAAISHYQNYLDELDRTIAKTTESEYASMRLRAEQLAQKEGIKDLTGAYERINNIQRGNSQAEVDKHARKLRDEAAAYAFQTSVMGESALVQEKLGFAQQKRLETENAIAAAMAAHKPLDAAAISSLREKTEETIRLGHAQRDERYGKGRTQEFGLDKAMRDYEENATNAAKNAESFFNGSVQRMEDSLISFAKTGKLSFSSLFGFMAEEYLRQMIRMQTASFLGGGASGGFGMLRSLFGMFTGSAIVGSTSNYNALSPEHHLATGTNYVPYDGMRAVLHKGEAVVPASYNPAAGGKGGGLVIDMSGQVLNVGQGVSRAEVASALRASQAQTVEKIRRLDRQGRFA